MLTGSLVPLNSTMLAIALGPIARDLDVAAGSAAVLVTAYLASMLVCQPPAGRLGDRVGSDRVLFYALPGFAVMSVMCALAPTFPLLLLGRCGQAVFGAALIPNSQALVRAVVAPVRRGRAFGIVGSGIGTGAAVGPVLGGVLLDVAGWPWIFAVNVPIVLAATLLLPRPSRVPREARPDGLPSRWAALRAPSFRAACGTQAASNFALYGVLLILPLVLAGRGWRGGVVGLSLSSLTFGSLVLAPVGGWLGDRFGRPKPILLGTSIFAVGGFVMAGWPGLSAALVAAPVLMGIGSGLSHASLQASALETVDQHAAASAAGLFSTSRYVGSMGASLLITVVGPTASERTGVVLWAIALAALIATGAALLVARHHEPAVVA